MQAQMIGNVQKPTLERWVLYAPYTALYSHPQVEIVRWGAFLMLRAKLAIMIPVGMCSCIQVNIQDA